MIRPTKFEIVCDGCGEVYHDVMGSEWSDPKNGMKETVEHGWITDTSEYFGCPEDCGIKPNYLITREINHYCPKCRKEKEI